MSKKKLEVVELNKKEEKIVLEEKQSRYKIFWKNHRGLIFLTLLLLSLTVLVLGIYMLVTNMYKSEQPTIEKVSIDTNLTEYTQNVTSGEVPITEETAKNSFLNNNKFKSKGEVLLVNTVEAGTYIIRFYSDGTAVKVLKRNNLITRINPLENGEYGITKDGVINTKAVTADVTIKKTKTFPWGHVTYYSDGSAEITDSQINMFVRDYSDINENYISNNKVTYPKETKNVGNIKLNYYYDGTIEVIKDNKSYLVRTENDLTITANNVTFKNNNQAQIQNTKKLDDGLIIDYYEDGGAIIRDGTRTLSVRKSNSIILKDNKIYEIVDNIYVTISKTLDNGNITYYTNASAVIKYNGNTLYVPENSDIKYQNGQISEVGENIENLTNTKNIDNIAIQTFEKTAVITAEDYIAIVPEENILYNSDGSLKEILTNDIDELQNEFTIINNTNEKIKYRVVIEKSSRTNLDVEYIRYQLSVENVYTGAKRLDENIWNEDYLANNLKPTGTNYILLDSTLEAHAKADIRLMLWTDYDTIPNSMQNKYFYGTIRVYAWKEKQNDDHNHHKH